MDAQYFRPGQQKTFCRSLTAFERAEAPAGAPVRDGGHGGDSILDTPTPPNAQINSSLSVGYKKQLNQSSRRVFSRSQLGMIFPAVYYWITWTSSPQSPPLKQTWSALRKYLKRIRSKSQFIYIITSEGYGVIHMIFRLAKGEKRLEVKELREHWQHLHKATQIKIRRIKGNPESVTKYLADQRQKLNIAGEVAWQDKKVRWMYSRGWLPKGFGRAFGRFWFKMGHLPPPIREPLLKAWLLACYADPANLVKPPFIDKKGHVKDYNRTCD